MSAVSVVPPFACVIGFVPALWRQRALGRVLLLCCAAALTLGCTPPVVEPTAADVAAYFGLSDGAERVFKAESGQEETHTYTHNGGFGEREVYDRVVRRGGFVQDDLTFQLEASVERGLEILRLYDCVSRCGELSAPIALLPWPMEGGESLETDVDVEVTLNGEPEETRSEHHAVQVGSASDVTVPAGTFSAFQIIWSRTTADDDGQSVQLVMAPEEGFLVSEGFDGAKFELQE